MVIIRKGKITFQDRPDSNKRTLLTKYNDLRKAMMEAGIHNVPPAITTGRKKWLSGSYGKLVQMAMA